jgi:uncharacterized protein
MKEPIKARSLPQNARLTNTTPLPAVYGGVLPVGRLPRLVAAIATPDGELSVSLELSRNRGALRLGGSVRGELLVICQRCLRQFAWPLDAAVSLRLVFSEDEEARVLSEEEPYLVEDERLPLHDLVEEEVLLALPYAPRCSAPDCRPD